MQLFRSEWLREAEAVARPSRYGAPASQLRYGGRGSSARGNAVATASGDNIVVADFQAEREVLRRMARYDHAA